MYIVIYVHIWEVAKYFRVNLLIALILIEINTKCQWIKSRVGTFPYSGTAKVSLSAPRKSTMALSPEANS